MALSRDEIAGIEAELAVSLPRAYAAYLARERTEEDLDDSEVLDDASGIVEATLTYREGFEGLAPWPPEWVYVGDQADACPYVVDCKTGRVVRLDKGNREREPLEQWASFDAFRAALEASPEGGDEEGPAFYYWLPLIFAMTTFFVVIPAIALGIRTLYRWLTG